MDKIRSVICDIETDDINPTLVWCIVCKDVDTKEVFKFWRPDVDGYDFIKFAKTVDTWIGHYFIRFDYWKVLRKFFKSVKINPLKIIDTCVLSKLFNYKRVGGHGLESWGETLGVKKPAINSFESATKEELLHRCSEDVEINYLLYKRWQKFIQDPRYAQAIELEHKMEFVCIDLEENGFPFDYDSAIGIRKELQDTLHKLDEEIKSCFPPKAFAIKEIVPRSTKAGTLNLSDFRWVQDPSLLVQFTPGEPFTRIGFQEFNPASVPQQIERLNEAGWKPFEKTDGHIDIEKEIKRQKKKATPEQLEKLARFKVYGWKVSEDNLSTLPPDAPEGARKLAERIILASRVSVLTEWINAYTPSKGTVNGRFNSIGSWTHRMSHQNPNQANIPSDPDVRDKKNPSPIERIKLDYGVNLRKLWTAGDDCLLVGTDAEGIQLRLLAHYMGDEDFIKALVEGDKDLGTDAHTLNAIRLGIGPQRRSVAKTFIYAFLLGAGVDKVAQILDTSTRGAATAIEMFLDSTPGLKRLKEIQIPKDAEKGYFKGLDGRLVPVENEHKVLAGYLQNGEAVVMKTANLIWRRELMDKGIWFRQVNFVHDEWQTRTRNNREEAELVGKIQAAAIVKAGQVLGLKCPMAGQSQIGFNWKETH